MVTVDYQKPVREPRPVLPRGTSVAAIASSGTAGVFWMICQLAAGRGGLLDHEPRVLAFLLLASMAAGVPAIVGIVRRYRHRQTTGSEVILCTFLVVAIGFLGHGGYTLMHMPP